MKKRDILINIDEHVIGRNAARNKQILIDLFIDGHSYSFVAEKFELSERQIHNISKKWRHVISE